MKAKFELRNWMSENRNVILAKYEALKTEQFFNGISLKEFMLQVLASMEMNNVRSEKTAASKLPFLMGNVYFENSKLTAKKDALATKYAGTAYMAMV